MTVEQQSGRAIIVLCLVVVVVTSLGFMIWDVVINGAAPLMVHLPRLGLIIAVFIWFLRGSLIARWILVAFLGIGGGFAMSTITSGAAGAIAAGICGLVYILLAAMLAMSSSVSTYLVHEQQKP